MFVLRHLIIGFQMLSVFARLHYHASHCNALHAQTIPDIYIVVWVRAVTSANIVWRCISPLCWWMRDDVAWLLLSSVMYLALQAMKGSTKSSHVWKSSPKRVVAGGVVILCATLCYTQMFDQMKQQHIWRYLTCNRQRSSLLISKHANTMRRGYQLHILFLFSRRAAKHLP